MSEMKKEEPREMNLVPTENVDKRTEYSKTYTVGPGKYQAFTSVIPLHRKNGETGKWEELDATFKAEKGNDVLESAGAQLTVSCGVSGEKVFIAVKDQEDHRLAWGYEEAEAVKPEAVKEEVKEEDHVLQAFFEAMANAQGTVRYSEIFPGVDMICRNDSRFKDEFIFSASEFARKIVCHLESNGLELSADENGTIVAFDTDGKKIYNIPAPILIDSEGQEGMVQVSLEGTEAGYRLIYEPDPEFMENAVYPVMLDPAIQTSGFAYSMEDTYIRSISASSNYSTLPSIYIVKDSANSDFSCGLVRMLDLPPLSANHYITNARIHFSVDSATGTTPYLYLKEVTSSWTASTVTWSSCPSISSIVQDYSAVQDGEVSFNVTGLLKKWYEGENLGVLLSPWESQCSFTLFSSDTGLTNKRPYLAIEYASLAGLEDYLTYDTISGSKAGTGYVSLANGNLVFTHSDTVMNGARMPVSVTHVYNSCDADKNDFFCGYGWRTNYHLTLHKELLNNVVYYVYTDEDGTEHWFKPVSNGKYQDESGLSMELTAGNPTTIRDKGDNVITFPQITATPTVTQQTSKVLVTSIADTCGNTITVTATGMKITKLTDGAGRETLLEYDNTNNLLIRIKTPWQNNNNCIQFHYYQKILDRITEEDGTYSYYSHYVGLGLDHPLMCGTSSSDGIRTEFLYDIIGSTDIPEEARHIIVSAKVYAYENDDSEKVANHTLYTYGSQLCLVKDQLTGNVMRYHFNDNGNVTSIDDGLGYAVYAKYNQANPDESPIPINHPTNISRVERVVNNLLVNGLFDKTTSWTKYGTGTISQSANSGEYGNYQKKFTVANGNTLYYRQTVSVTAGQTYTLSGFARSLGAKAYVRVIAGSQTFSSLPIELTGTETETELTRTQVTFTVPAGISQIQVDLVAVGTSQGTIVWWDCAQLEVGETANHVNLLDNGDLHTITGSPLPSPWHTNSGMVSAISRNNCQVQMPVHLTGNALRVPGKCNATRRVWQSVPVSGATRFTVGGWCSAFAKKPEDNSIICELQVYFANTNSDDWNDWTYGGSAYFHHEEGNWQFACGDVYAPDSFSWARVVIVYDKQVNYADFSNLFLYKEQYGMDIEYDANGNQTHAANTTGNSDESEYDTFNNLTKYTAPGHSLFTVNEWGSTDTEKRKHLLKKSTSPLGTVRTFQYDAYGNQTEGKVSESSSSSAKFIKDTAAYTSAGTYVASQTDGRGKTVTTVTDVNKGVVTSVTDPMNHVVNTTYDILRRPTKTSTMLNSQEVKTESAYDATKGYLKTLKHNTTTAASGDVTYTFDYDTLGRQISVKVGTNVLSTTAYDALTRQISQVTFGNGDKVHNTYDNFGRLTGVRYDNETGDRFTYCYDANGRVGMMQDHEQDTLAYTDYDRAGRPLWKTKLKNGAHLYTGRIQYDEDTDLPIQYTELVGANKERHDTAFEYDQEDRVKKLKYDSSDNEKVDYTYDSLGRIVTRTVTVNGHANTTTYTYYSGAYGTYSTTNLIHTITQNGVTLTYTYDNNGNITSVYDGTKTVSYVYDAIGQLIRVNDPYDNRSGSSGTTWTFEYDLGGNILNRKRYAYTTGTLPGTYLQRILYGYSDSTWKDKLTSYNGVAISTDSIGNITEYGAWTYQWRHGRELVHMSRSQYQPIEVDFEYNEDGLRTKKTITDENDVVTVTEYTLHGKNIVHMKKGVDNLHFFYDGQGKPSIVAWNNGTTTNKYAYVYNLQGDVIALVNSAGTKVVNYTYDAWGKPITKSGSLAGTLGTLNPFRYRGYVYDDEIDFYYLRSRYYNANRGRFINADTVADEKNLFSYCGNDPIDYEDESGDTYVSAKKTNVMKYPNSNKNNKVLNTLEKGKKVSVLFHVSKGTVDETDKWCYISYNNGKQHGYVLGSTLSDMQMEQNSFGYKVSSISVFGDNVIRYGQIGLPVYNVQLTLYKNGYLDSQKDCDGVYGPKTYEGIMRFQSDNYLKVDGLVGNETKKTMLKQTIRNSNHDIVANRSIDEFALFH